MKDPDNPKQRYLKQCKNNNALTTWRLSRSVWNSGLWSSANSRWRRPFRYSRIRGLISTSNGSCVAIKVGAGPRPVKTNEVAEWLFVRLREAPLMMRDLVEQAQEAGHIHPATERHPKPSISILYDASDRIPTLHPGCRVEESTVEAGIGQGRKPRKRWTLIQPGGGETRHDAPAVLMADGLEFSARTPNLASRCATLGSGFRGFGVSPGELRRGGNSARRRVSDALSVFLPHTRKTPKLRTWP